MKTSEALEILESRRVELHYEPRNVSNHEIKHQVTYRLYKSGSGPQYLDYNPSCRQHKQIYNRQSSAFSNHKQSI